MSLRLRAMDGSMTAWAPADPRAVFLLVSTFDSGPATAARARAAASAALGTLAFLGFEMIARKEGAADLLVCVAPGPGARLVVAPASTEEASSGALSSRGFSREDFGYLCLKTHPRKPLPFSWEALAAARGELSDLRALARALSGVTLEPSSRGVVGYQHRFREALSLDFDFPEALSCVWASLRPGALSPGSRAAFLRTALPALALDSPLFTKE